MLYLRGLSTGDFRQALPLLLGEDAAGLSPTAITRLLKVWQEEYVTWRKRSLVDSDYVYLWADGVHFGVHFGVRLEEERLACLVLIGAKPDRTKEVIALEDGYRESKESWLQVLRDLQQRGLRAPTLAVGDGALGFWTEVLPIQDPRTALGHAVHHPVAGAGCSRMGRKVHGCRWVLSTGIWSNTPDEGTTGGRVAASRPCRAPLGMVARVLFNYSAGGVGWSA